MTDLGTLGGTISFAFAINDLGQVAGGAETSNGEIHAFLWEAGVMLDLGTLGGDLAEPNDIDSQGRIVGGSRTAGGSLEGFIWEDGTMMNLNDLIPSGSGWILSTARGINEGGQIVGGGTINGEFHAYLLTPVPSNTACSDGLDNDGDGLIDYPTDLQCWGAEDASEHRSRCGLGFELALVLPLLMGARTRQRGRRR
jgi:probable HAF family extracellular repeat protein